MSTILELCKDVPVRVFAPGTVLLSEGTQSGALCILVHGEVEILRGDFQVSAVSDPGAVFGEMSILLGSAHTATVRARTSCRVHVIEDGKAVLKSDKDIAYDLLKTLAQRLNAVTNYLTDLNRYVRAI